MFIKYAKAPNVRAMQALSVRAMQASIIRVMDTMGRNVELQC